MNARNKHLFVISCLIVLITGCGLNQTSIQSVTPDKVIITGPPGNFTDAYHIAQNECQKNAKSAQYTPDNTAGLGVLAFNCVGEEEETEAVSTETEGVPAETEDSPSQ